MICIVALVVFGILGIFHAKYRAYAKEAFRCVSRRLILKPCDTSFDQNMKSKITSKLIKRSPSLAKFTFKHFESISWIMTIVMIVSLAYSVYAVSNLVIYGTCDPVTNNCVFNPSQPNQIVCPFEDIDIKNAVPTIGGFSKIESATIKGEPMIYLFGTTWCPHCKWERQVFVNVTSKFGTWEGIKENDLSSAEFNSSYMIVKAIEIDLEKNSPDNVVFDHYSPNGYVPVLVFGGKYFRVGSGESLGADQEKAVLTALLCKITDNPISECNNPEIKSLIGQI
jgi:thiol-disulfide isomerase/thioredoxin